LGALGGMRCGPHGPHLGYRCSVCACVAVARASSAALASSQRSQLPHSFLTASSQLPHSFSQLPSPCPPSCPATLPHHHHQAAFDLVVEPILVGWWESRPACSVCCCEHLRELHLSAIPQLCCEFLTCAVHDQLSLAARVLLRQKPACGAPNQPLRRRPLHPTYSLWRRALTPRRATRWGAARWARREGASWEGREWEGWALCLTRVFLTYVQLSPEGYAWMAQRLRRCVAGGRLVLALEGGYNARCGERARHGRGAEEQEAEWLALKECG
jgi:hypothetical protein